MNLSSCLPTAICAVGSEGFGINVQTSDLGITFNLYKYKTVFKNYQCLQFTLLESYMYISRNFVSIRCLFTGLKISPISPSVKMFGVFYIRADNYQIRSDGHMEKRIFWHKNLFI